VNRNIFLISAFVLLCIISAGVLQAQVIKQEQTQSNTNIQNPYLQNQTSSNQGFKINADMSDIFSQIGTNNMMNVPGTPMEGAVDPKTYIIGPNDLFMFGLYGYINQQLQLYVNPEGSVVIPTVGEIQVDGLNLEQAKEKVVAAVKKRYYSSDVSFSLLTPRTFLINITGLVQAKYQVTPLMRTSDLLKYIVYDSSNVSRKYFENVVREKTDQEAVNKTQLSMRNIKLERKDGSTVNVDLYKYYMTNNDEFNPHLREGDVLKIPYVSLTKSYVTVEGAVQLGGVYEYAEGDNLETVIGLGRGFDNYAEKDSILIYRPNKDKAGFQSISLRYDDNKDYKIDVYDRIFVKYNSDVNRLATVLVLGEIQRPGYYPITYKGTKIKDVIQMAGGLKPNASLPLSILFRRWDAEYTTKDSMEIYVNQRANDLIISEMDKKNFDVDLKSRRNRVVIDFEKLLMENDESQNILLEDKDVVYINDNKNIVYVFGQVNNEGYVPYEEGKNYEYYVQKAGGYSLAADEGNTRVIRFNSRGWYKAGDVEPRSGDFVYVPKHEKKEFKDVMTIISQVAAVILGVLTTYILIKNK
jgi:protein involved in polysaccharide export with SLBB domain